MPTQQEIQRQYFADPVSKPRMHPERFGPVAQRHLKAVHAHLPRETNRVLEIGAGMGRFTFPLRELGYEVVANDLSPDLLEVLQEHDRSGSVLTVRADATDLTLEQVRGPVEAVVGFFVLHHLPDLEEALKTIRRLLGPEGMVAFVEPNPWHFGYFFQVTLTPGMSWRAEKGLLRMHRKVLEPAFTAAGFVDLAVEGHGWLPPFLARRPGWRAFERAIESLSLMRHHLAYQTITATAGTD